MLQHYLVMEFAQGSIVLITSIGKIICNNIMWLVYGQHLSRKESKVCHNPLHVYR